MPPGRCAGNREADDRSASGTERSASININRHVGSDQNRSTSASALQLYNGRHISRWARPLKSRVAARRPAGCTARMYGSCIARRSTRVESLDNSRVAFGVPWSPVDLLVCPCDVALVVLHLCTPRRSMSRLIWERTGSGVERLRCRRVPEGWKTSHALADASFARAVSTVDCPAAAAFGCEGWCAGQKGFVDEGAVKGRVHAGQRLVARRRSSFAAGGWTTSMLVWLQAWLLMHTQRNEMEWTATPANGDAIRVDEWTWKRSDAMAHYSVPNRFSSRR